MKQITRILKEVNYDLDKIQIVKCLAAHNEEGWIEYNLANCYNEFDKIRVVEGAVEGRPNSTPDGHSTDRTLDIIREFPDPDNKIELFTMCRPFKSLEEQKQLFLSFAKKDTEWMIICDADEFYMEGSIDRIRKAIYQHPMAMEFIPTFLHFYRDFEHIRDYDSEWNLWHSRIIRFQDSMRFHTHPVPTIGTYPGKCTYFSPEFQMDRYIIPDLFVYHYGHSKSVEFHRKKCEFYHSELMKFKLEDGTDASQKFDEKFREFSEFKEDLDSVLSFKERHPGVMYNHPLMSHKEKFYTNKEFKDFRKSKAYSSRLPTIPQWMMYSKRMEPFYNIMEV